MTQQSNEKLKSILERKFQLIKDNRNEKMSFAAMIDYYEFLGNSEELTRIIHQLIEEDRIAPICLEQMFNDYLHSYYLKFEVPEVKTLPRFYTPEIEAKFKLMQKFVELNGDSYERWQKTYKVYIDPNKAAIPTDRKDAFFHAQRLHNDLIDKLTSAKPTETEVAPEVQISFSPEKSALLINGKLVEITKFSDPYTLLKIMFEDSSRIYDEWFYSEMAEKFDRFGKLPEKKFYNATYQLKQKIQLKTGYDDVFTSTNHSIQLNPKYVYET
jgi:hypothetical protein